VYPKEEAHRIQAIQPVIQAYIQDPNTLAIHIRSGLEASNEESVLWHPMSALGMAAFVIKQHQGHIQADYGPTYTDYCITLPLQRLE
jgi:hypothetical protein